MIRGLGGTMMENEMEKTVGNEMETGFIEGLVGKIKCHDARFLLQSVKDTSKKLKMKGGFF